MNLSVSRLTRVDLRPIVEKLQSPTALLDAAGNLDSLNAPALPLWQIFHLDGTWLSQQAAQRESLSTILPRLLSLGIPTRVAGLDNALVSAVPLRTPPFNLLDGYWLEWLGNLDITASSPEIATLSEQLAIYQDVAQAVNSSLVLEDIFESLADVLARYIPYDEAVILILDHTQNGIKLLVKMYPDGTLDISGENNAFAGYDPVVDHALRSQQTQIYPLHTTQAEKTTDALPESLVLAVDARSGIVVPLVNKGMVVGLIALSSRQQTAYNAIYSELLLQVSTQLSVAVENARLYWQTQAQASREFLINQLTMAIRQSLDIDVILSTAVMELGKVLGVSRCFIRYFEPSHSETGQEVFPETTSRLFAYNLPGVPPMPYSENAGVSDNEDIELHVFRMRKEQTHNPFILNDVRDCPPQLMTQDFFAQHQIKSLAIIPILIRNTLVGTITLHQCEAYRSWVIEDIELIKAMAEHLGVALHQATLFHSLDHNNRRLEEALAELQQAQLYLIQSEKMAVLGQFVAGIAHEVNTPLGTMISNTNTMKTCMNKLQALDLPESPDNERLLNSMNGLLDLNKMAGERIQEIVKNLRNFARLDESELKTVDIHEGIDSTLLVISSSIPPKVEIIRKYAADIPKLPCYPGLLNQVFMNLIVNAVHALDDKLQSGGHSTISIQTHFEPSVMSPGAGLISVYFTDTGKGIAPENIARIFDPGFTTKGVGVGTGLGLALCYRIIEKHHGRILVESVIGEGTTFTVQLPYKGPI